MSVIETLFQGEYSSILDAFKKDTGINSEQLGGIAASLMPKITETMSNAMSDPGSIMQIFSLASRVDLASIAEKPSSLMSEEVREVGEAALRQFFGGAEDVADMISSLSAELSIGVDTLSKALPALTASLLGLVANPAASAGLSSMMSAVLAGNGPLGEGEFGSLLAGLGIGSDEDESTADIMNMAKGLLSQR